MSEATDQMALMHWAQIQVNQGTFPELDFLAHIPNGEKRDKATAARLSLMGVRAGIPDLILPVARGRYNCWWGELKVRGNRPSPEQIIWHGFLIRHGHKLDICYGWEDAAARIVEYLSLKDVGR